MHPTERTSLVLLLSLLAAGVAGCASTPPAEPPAAGDAPSLAGEASPAATPDAPAAPGQAAAPGAPAAPARKAETVDDCKAMLASLPEGPLPETAPGAAAPGGSDRMPAMIEFMKLKREGFRCCFDIWSRKIPDARLYGKVTFSLELKPDGSLRQATVKPEEGALPVAKEVEGCLVDVAGTITYPKSPSGKDTTYTHRFDFKPRRY